MQQQQVRSGKQKNVAVKNASMSNRGSTAGARPAAIQPVSVFLCTDPNSVDCRFWIGLTQPGELTPQQLLDLPDVKGLFQRAAASGIQESTPLMLSDTSYIPARYFFIMKAPSGNESESSDWVKQVVEALRSWSPPCAGFIMSPKLLELPSARELLVKVLEQTSASTQTRQFFFSVENHGFNSGLNAMLKLKGELEVKGIKVHVFH